MTVYLDLIVHESALFVKGPQYLTEGKMGLQKAAYIGIPGKKPRKRNFAERHRKCAFFGGKTPPSVRIFLPTHCLFSGNSVK